MTHNIENLVLASKSGLLSRREFISRAGALGVGTGGGISFTR